MGLIEYLAFVTLVLLAISAQSSSQGSHNEPATDEELGETEGPYTFDRGHHRRGDRGHNGHGHTGATGHNGKRGHTGPDHPSGSSGHTGIEKRMRSSSSHTNQDDEQYRTRPRCSIGRYINRSTGRCTICSTCPVNEIIRRPCSLHRDTVCGPFYEFKPGQGGSHRIQQDDPGLKAMEESRQHSNRADHHEQDSQGTNQGSGGKDIGSNKPGEEQDSSVDSPHTQEMADGQTKGPTVARSADQWRELCYGLIGALAGVTLLAVLYIIVTQIHARRHHHKYSDAHCRTVLSPTMRVFANGLLSNTDYQKITTYNDDPRSRPSRNWLLRHIRCAFRRENAQLNQYITERDMMLSTVPEVVEMDRLQGAPPPAPTVHQVHNDQGQDVQGQGQAAQGQGQDAQGHAAQGQRLGSTQSWDSGISTHEGNKL